MKLVLPRSGETITFHFPLRGSSSTIFYPYQGCPKGLQKKRNATLCAVNTASLTRLIMGLPGGRDRQLGAPNSMMKGVGLLVSTTTGRILECITHI